MESRDMFYNMDFAELRTDVSSYIAMDYYVASAKKQNTFKAIIARSNLCCLS